MTKEPPISHESDSPSVFFFLYVKKGAAVGVVDSFVCVHVATVAMVTKDCVRTLHCTYRIRHEKMFEEKLKYLFSCSGIDEKLVGRRHRFIRP